MTIPPLTAVPEGDLVERSMLGMDRESEQACAVRLRAQLSDRHRERRHCGCRGHAGADLRRGRMRQKFDAKMEQYDG
jgi:hypothetical protein